VVRVALTNFVRFGLTRPEPGDGIGRYPMRLPCLRIPYSLYDAVNFGAAAQRNNGGKFARRDRSAVFAHYPQLEVGVVPAARFLYREAE
jgi:hypothetical protein